MKMKEYQKKFVEHLIETGAVKFGKFKLKSGRISPYFVNIAKAMEDGAGALKVANAYVNAIQNLKLGFTFLYGPAYKGIPLSSVISVKLWEDFKINIRWGYNRKEVKNYGDKSEKLLVGNLQDGDTVLIVDDVITTGYTKIECWRTLKELKKVKPAGILIAVDRQEMTEKDKKALQDCNLKIFSIVKIEDLFEYSYKKGYISEELKDEFEKYINNLQR